MSAYIFNQHQQVAQEQQLNMMQQTYERNLRRAHQGFIALGVFVVLIAGVLIVRQFKTYQDIQDGKFYRNQILSYQLHPAWQLTLSQMQEEASSKSNIIEKGKHQITRKQLGKMGWTLLHMLTGTFPNFIDHTMQQKFNTFLILFAQMYPCKLCANHFIKLLKQFGPFQGRTKEQLMIYMCRLHNKVNQRLQKPQQDCKLVPQEWNTCGCNDK